MNYYRESLTFVPDYISPNASRPDFSLYSLDSIFQEPLSPKDRKDLNRIYEQADMFVKRNSIASFNKKNHKKFLTATITPPNLSSNKSISKGDPFQPNSQYVAR